MLRETRFRSRSSPSADTDARRVCAPGPASRVASSMLSSRLRAQCFSVSASADAVALGVLGDDPGPLQRQLVRATGAAARRRGRRSARRKSAGPRRRGGGGAPAVDELLVRDRRHLDVEGPLREACVAVPSGPGLLLGLRDLLASANRVDQPDEPNVGARALQPDPARIGHHTTQRPSGKVDGPLPCDLQQLRHVLGGALLDGALDPLDAVRRRLRRQSLQQRFIHHRRTTRRVEYEDGNFRCRPAPSSVRAACARIRRAHRLQGVRARRMPAPRWSGRT